MEGDQPLAVRAERHAVGGVIGRPFQRDQIARGEVPDQDRVIATARGQAGAVGTEGRRGHLVGGAVEREGKRPAGRRVPELDIAWCLWGRTSSPGWLSGPGADQPLAVRREGDRAVTPPAWAVDGQQAALDEAAR